MTKFTADFQLYKDPTPEYRTYGIDFFKENHSKVFLYKHLGSSWDNSIIFVFHSAWLFDNKVAVTLSSVNNNPCPGTVWTLGDFHQTKAELAPIKSLTLDISN